MQLQIVKGDGSVPSKIKILMQGKLKKRKNHAKGRHVNSGQCITYENHELCKVSFIITTKVTHGYLDEYKCMVGLYC